MKIGFFSYSLSGVGPRTRARTLIETLASRTDHDIVVVTGPNEDYNHRNVERHRINDLPLGAATGLRTVKRAFADVDVVHIPINLYQVLYVRSVYDGPLVAGAGVQHDIHYRTAAKVLGIDHIIETHEFTSYLWEQSGYESTPIYPSVDEEVFYEYDVNQRQAVRSDLGIDPGQRAVLFVGTLGEYKGAHIYADAIDKLDEHETDVVGLIAGTGPLQERFEDGSSFIYEGYVDNPDLPPLYNAADVTVVPSVAESFSLVSLESIACGTPVVTTAQDGSMVRLFKPRNTYVWAEERSSEAVAKAVLELLSDDEFYEEQRQRGFDTIDQMGLTISDTLRKHLAAYRAAIEHR